ncbi:MAG: ABC transporter ATP-binding protein/permease [Oscillospiraceae bacterium]|nr:ABC transporter ATP-binding protein/permease [Oscillospiraceae bacterium]
MPKGKGGSANPKVLGRLIKMLMEFFPFMVPLTVVCILFSSIVSAIPDMYIQQVIKLITDALEGGWSWEDTSAQLIPKMVTLVVLYLLALAAVTLYTQLMAFITQGFLDKMRQSMFRKMQNLPLRYFDTHKHGDIMSTYTNDTDALRQLISQALPTLLRAGTVVIVVFGIMIYYSLWLTLFTVVGVVAIMFASGKMGGGSAKYFIRQQQSVGKAEGYIQEMMNGQKVIKVFNHEKKAQAEFDKINEELCSDAYRANAYANTLGPVVMNIGNILYVLLAVIGGALVLIGMKNPSIYSLVMAAKDPAFKGLLDVSIVVAFLNMTKQFTGNVNQVAQQINAVVMALAGAERIFAIMDAEPEPDNGYVKLVNAEIAADGTITETERHTGHWAWKHPHQADGTVTYTKLEGDVMLDHVDFGYVPEKTVLHDVCVYAKPGQKIAFVGSTGAGKTTITNLINRFYDIADGKIRYDGININKIVKSDLRRSLGIVLQETNLFTGTVMDNIRYGKLDATDEECIAAAKLAGADDFITRLPGGYDTELTGNGANLSQGQRQLIAIARAAVADPPVMIMDEATSSIDTRTEAIVAAGMDKLMEGRTVFVIAHRLSTVRNSDVIMVLDHGSIIERGSHDQLIAKKGQYYKLYTGAFELE